jgi:hypothetical protein
MGFYAERLKAPGACRHDLDVEDIGSCLRATSGVWLS